MMTSVATLALLLGVYLAIDTHCIQHEYFDQLLTYETAVNQCLGTGMTLSMPKNQELWDQLIAYFDSIGYSNPHKVWFGLEIDDNNTWIWADGELLSWNNWENGQLTQEDTRKCAQMVYVVDEIWWKNDDCGHSHPGVCQANVSTTENAQGASIITTDTSVTGTTSPDAGLVSTTTLESTTNNMETTLISLRTTATGVTESRTVSQLKTTTTANIFITDVTSDGNQSTSISGEATATVSQQTQVNNASISEHTIVSEPPTVETSLKEDNGTSDPQNTAVMSTTTNDANEKEKNPSTISHDVETTDKAGIVPFTHPNYCNCSYNVIAEETLMKMEMEIKVSINTFREKLRLTIDDDSRSSTKGVAAVAIVFLCVAFGGIVLSDVWTLVTNAKQHHVTLE